ncbi:MAG TPA: hypothetical protein VEL75_05405 [Candidatus Methylomirabilis sp.]|nr:hypothetical protein [Candidatus Methylomirabilis sp.]
MASVAREVELRCGGDEAACRLVSPVGLRCFPGLSPGPGDLPAVAEHEFELPYLGTRRQLTELRAERSAADARHEVVVSGSGPLISYAARWSIGNRGDGRPASLTFEYEVSDALLIDAVNELRSRSPLPFRSDADAILRLAVGEAFLDYFGRVMAEYADAVRARLEARA